MLNGGHEPERLLDWYKALHTIDSSRVTSKAITEMVLPPATNTIVAAESSPPTPSLPNKQPGTQMPSALTPERKAFLRDLAEEIVRGVKVRQQQVPGPQRVPTHYRFVILEPDADKALQEMA